MYSGWVPDTQNVFRKSKNVFRVYSGSPKMYSGWIPEVQNVFRMDTGSDFVFRMESGSENVFRDNPGAENVFRFALRVFR